MSALLQLVKEKIERASRTTSGTRFYQIKSSLLADLDKEYVDYIWRKYDLDAVPDVQKVKKEKYPTGFSKDTDIEKQQIADVVTAAYSYLPIQTDKSMSEIVENTDIDVESGDIREVTAQDNRPIHIDEDLVEGNTRELRNLSTSSTMKDVEPIRRLFVSKIAGGGSNDDNDDDEDKAGDIDGKGLNVVPKNLCPQWRVSADPQLAFNHLLAYITSLKRFSKRKYFKTESLLIEQSLSKSDRLELVDSLPPGVIEDVDAFTDYLMANYAPPEDERRRMLHQIHQKTGETAVAFIVRTLTLYSLVKLGRNDVISLEDLDKPENADAWAYVLSLILSGLSTDTLRMHLKLKRNELKGKNLLSIVRTMTAALPEFKAVMTAQVQRTQANEYCELTQAIREMKSSLVAVARDTKSNQRSGGGGGGKFDKRNDKGKKAKSDMECHSCGKKDILKAIVGAYTQEKLLNG